MTELNSAAVTAPPLLPRGSRTSKVSPLGAGIGLALFAVCVVGLFVSSEPWIAGLWCIAMMVCLMFISVPVAIALAVPSVIGVYGLSGIPATVNILSTAPYNSVSNWTYSVLPMFIFMGMLLTNSGMTTRLYRATDRWFSWLPGGIGIGTTAAGAGLSSVSGSTIGMTYALGRAGIPEMLRAGYDRRIAVGAVIVAGLPGNLIPPSILLVVYAGIASVPVGPQLIAGTVPGIALALTFALFILIMAIIFPSMFGKSKQSAAENRVTWRQRFSSLGEIWGFPLILIVLFGGMFSGAFTPTEAGAAAALMSLILCVFYTRGEHPWRRVIHSALQTVSASAAIFFIIIGAEMLTKLMALTGLAPLMTDLITGIGFGRIGFLIALILLYLVMGMFFDTLSMMLLTIPILLPTLEVMGVSPIWFGVFVVLLGELGMITPPVGVLTYIVHNITRSPEVNLGQAITLRDVFIALIWFLPVAIVFLLIMIFVPDMVEWLPSLMSS